MVNQSVIGAPRTHAEERTDDDRWWQHCTPCRRVDSDPSLTAAMGIGSERTTGWHTGPTTVGLEENPEERLLGLGLGDCFLEMTLKHARQNRKQTAGVAAASETPHSKGTTRGAEAPAGGGECPHATGTCWVAPGQDHAGFQHLDGTRHSDD